MDVHRCRFVPYPASAINAVAFSHASLPKSAALRKKTQVRLALGRANGDIEIWNPLNGAWHQEIVIAGGKDRSIDGLVWVNAPDEVFEDGRTIAGRSRLFSIGYTATVTEWDLAKARAKAHASGQHGDIWCLAAQPPPSPTDNVGSNAPSSILVAGTNDGSLVLYSTEDDDLRFHRVLVKDSKKKTKMTSIAFQTSNIAVVGCSDSTVRVYDVRRGAILRQMTLGSDLVGGSKFVIVWAVKCLPNGDIVSGDSTGQICIWDGKTYTQAQRIQSHTQDVLSLATSADGTRIISGGMDRRTVFYEPMAGQRGRWTKTWHRRYHSHDVKAMASFEGNGKSVVVSGGPDASPVVVPLRAAGKEHHRTLSYLPHSPPLRSARGLRVIVSWWEREVHLWKLLPPNASSHPVNTMASSGRDYQRLWRIFLKGESNITSAAISEDGELLAVATAVEIKMFQLGNSTPAHEKRLSVRKVDVTSTKQGATSIQISPDKKWVCWIEEGSSVVLGEVITSDNSLGTVVYSLPRSSLLKRLRRKHHKHASMEGLGPYDRTITQMSFSADSKMLAVADQSGFIDTWILRGSNRLERKSERNESNDDAMSSASSEDSSDAEEARVDDAQWIRNPRSRSIPKLTAAPVCLSFSREVPGLLAGTTEDVVDDYTLLAITTSMEVVTFNPLRGSLSDWSRRNPYTSLPHKMRSVRDLAKGVIWQGSKVWIYGVSFLFMLDLSVNHSADNELPPVKNGLDRGTKRKRGETDGGAGGKMEKHASAPQLIRTKDHSEGNGWVDFDPESEVAGEQATSSGAEEDDQDDEDDSGGGKLHALRRKQEEVDGQVTKRHSQTTWWHSFKYRPILGVVPINDGPDMAADMELAIVERPTWDLDMPERYFGNGEWER